MIENRLANEPFFLSILHPFFDLYVYHGEMNFLITVHTFGF